MLHRRVLPVVLAVLTAVAITSPAAAGKPHSGPRVIGGGPPANEPWIPPTAEEQELIDAKIATATAIEDLSRGSATRAPGVAATCVVTTGVAGVNAAPPPPCEPWDGYQLTTYARRQTKDYYCGPATAQVIINRSRDIYRSDVNGENAATNYRTQTYIASRLRWYNAALHRWENTDLIGQTNAYMLTAGLNELAKLPTNFAYAVVATGTGAQWHAKIITDTREWHMAFGVAIKMTSTSPRLSSWGPIAARAEVHHWIPIRGYSGGWDGSDTPRVYYNDSSDKQGGGTGSYSDSSLKVYNLNHWHTARVVW